jgi:hypothetical protein
MVFPLFEKFPYFGDVARDQESQLAAVRRQEALDADAQAFHAVAYLSMPDDLRLRAEEWGVPALMEAVWMNAFGCGYKQANRDRRTSEQSDG